MRLITDISEIPQVRGGAVSIGNFDGVHRGHAQIIKRLVAAAATHCGPAIVFTFDPHPVRLLRPDEVPPPLTWTRRKADLLSQLGVDGMIAYPTDDHLLQLSPEAFFRSIVVNGLKASAMVEGPNFFFGRNRAGHTEVLRELCNRYGVELEIVTPLVIDDTIVSSSRIRKAIADGQVGVARELLTQPYRLRGMVTHGAGRGGKIGFPTANLDAIDTLIPAPGVYAGKAHRHGKSYRAAINIGSNPTFGESTQKVEIHMLDFTGDLYGEPLEVDFLLRLRDIQPFPSVAALTQQLQLDIEAARAAP